MFRLCRAQLIKVFLRNDVKCILVILGVLPVVISFLISIESGIIQIGNSIFGAMGYASVVVGLLNSLLLISVTLAMITTALVSREIDNGLDCMYITKVDSRENIIVSKMIAVDVLTIALFFVLVCSSIVGWFVFLKDSPFGNTIFLSDDHDEAILLIYTVLGSLFEMFVMTKIYTLLSVMFKYGRAIILNFSVIVVFKLLVNIEQIREWIPSYIGGATGLYEYAGNELSQQCLENLGILLGYVILLCIIDYWVYKKIDLSR